MLRSLLTILIVLLPLQAAAVINYQLDLELHPDQQRLVATALIAPDASVPQQVELRLSPACRVTAVRQEGIDLAFSFENSSLKINLKNRAPFSISYHGHFTDEVAAVPVHNEDPSYGISTSISAAGTFLSAAANWYPRFVSEDIHFQVRIAAPVGIEAVTSGQRLYRRTLEEKTESAWQIDYPLYGLTLSAGHYQVFEDLNGPVPIYAYFYPETAPLAANYLTEARSYLKLYEELFGIYPFDKFAIVENFFPTGYGFPSWTLLGSSVVKLPFIVKTSLGHEMAHSWWGTGVRVDYAQGNWAEGLTTYVADHLYKERSSKAEALEYRLKILRDYSSLVSTDNRFPVAEFLSRHDKASQSIGYGKTAMIFHMLRQEVGNETFWCSLRELAQQNLYETLGWKDFETAFSTASGKDLQPFFQQWLQRTVGPSIALRGIEVTEQEGLYQLTGELVQEPPHYQLTVNLMVETEIGVVQHPVRLESASQNFNIALTDRPVRLIADPDADLFRELQQNEIPPTVNSIRGSQDLLVIQAEKFQPSLPAISMLMGGLRIAELPLQKLSQVNKAELAKHDLLIFGSSEQLVPQMLKDGKLVVKDQVFDLQGKSAFIVSSNPMNNEKTAAWFVSNQNVDDAVVARKIPHYGKYSYLLFDKFTNSLKRTSEPRQSTLRVDFDR